MSALNNSDTGVVALNDFIALNEEIAAVVRARMPLEAHLAKVGAELPGKAGELANRIGQHLANGETLPDAMEIECASMPAVYRATIEAGAESGQLGAAIESLVDTASRVDQLRRITGMSLIYPIIILTVTCLLLAMLITQVVPQFAWLEGAYFGPLAWLSSWPREVIACALIVPVAVVTAAAIWWRRSGRVGGASATRSRLLFWLPGARAVHRWSEAATFSELLLLLVERGIPLDRSLHLVAGATDDVQLRTAATEIAERVRLGESTGTSGRSVLDARELPLLIRLALHHSSNRELFSASLQQATVVYRDRAIRAADWYAEYAPMLLSVGIGGTLTACYALLVLWPYASMLRDLAR